jgi:hypothetical protein
MITLITILLTLAAIGAYKFFIKEEDMCNISPFFVLPLAIACVVVPAIVIVALLTAIVTYLP